MRDCIITPNTSAYMCVFLNQHSVSFRLSAAAVYTSQTRYLQLLACCFAACSLLLAACACCLRLAACSLLLLLSLLLPLPLPPHLYVAPRRCIINNIAASQPLCVQTPTLHWFRFGV